MLTGFFLHLKAHKLPVSTRELLTLLEALEKRVISLSLDDFYTLSRACFVKDEQHFDRFDLAFGSYFKGIDAIFDIRAEHSRGVAEARNSSGYLSDEDKKQVEALGGWDKLMETLKKRLEEQRARHQGGSKWIGTGGTSPFGAYGYNPEGIRIGQDGGGSKRGQGVGRAHVPQPGRRRRAQHAQHQGGAAPAAPLRARGRARGARPRRARSRAPRATPAGSTCKLQPERRNRVKVLLFLDVGGSMDPHVRMCEELFSAAKAEFRHLEYFYFHNCVYDHVWRDNGRRRNERFSTLDLIHTYGPDWKVIFVGDAAMSPYELVQAGGSVEYTNDEPGIVWLHAHLRPLPARRVVEPGARARVGVHALHADRSCRSWARACFR